MVMGWLLPQGAGPGAEEAGLGTSLPPELSGATGFELNTQQNAPGSAATELSGSCLGSQQLFKGLVTPAPPRLGAI